MAEWAPSVKRVAQTDDSQSKAFINGLLSERRYDEALKEAELILSRDPDNFAGLFAKARAYQGKKEFAPAVDAFRAASRVDPMHSGAHLLCGICAFMIADKALAEEKFEASISTDGTRPGGYVGLAQLQWQRGDAANARHNLDKALEINPDLSVAIFLRAMIDMREGQHNSAVEALQGQVQRNPDHRVSVLALSTAYTRAGRDAEAEALLSRLYEKSPDPMIAGSLAKARIATGQYAEAEALLRSATGGDANRMIMAVRELQLTEALIPQGKLDEARAILNRMPRFGPFSAPIHLRTAELLVAEGSLQQAILSYRAALQQTDKGKELITTVEKELLANGLQNDPEAAIRAYSQAGEEASAAMRQSAGDRDWQGLFKNYSSMMSGLAETE
ncbi:MAG: tetratricopeptide repeat protein [Pseudomonadota bacterium]